MSEKKKRKFYTVWQIDTTGARGPHQKQLDGISDANIKYFINKDIEEIKAIVHKDLGGQMGNVGLDEDWTVTLELFPEVNIHLVYTYFGDEFGDVEAEFRFIFSGERVYWTPGEELASYIGIIFDFFERQFKNREPYQKSYEKKTESMKKILTQRKKPFELLKEEDKKELISFIGANISISAHTWKFKKEIFPEIFIELSYDTIQKKLDISYSGENLEKIESTHLELIGGFLINQLIRYITMANQKKELPDICYMMFSRLLSKEKDWTYRKIEGLEY
jgi:hypothetical protein